jgi:methionine synthase II (cobalamin-independent)
MVDVAALKSLPIDKEVAVGVIDVHTSRIETPGQVAERIRKVLEVVPPERVYLTTDCGMKPLARMGGPDEAASAAPGSAIGPRGAWEKEKE